MDSRRPSQPLADSEAFIEELQRNGNCTGGPRRNPVVALSGALRRAIQKHRVIHMCKFSLSFYMIGDIKE
jgi:hypothetical protein